MKIETIEFRGNCDIQAAASNEKMPTFEMEAYNGGVMSVAHYGPVVVDLEGLSAGDVVPILYGHDSWQLDSIVGQSAKVEISDKLTASGQIMGESETVKQIIALAKKGFRFQASIGASIQSAREVDSDETVTVNGRELQGPFLLAEKSELNEISIVPLGADKTTKTAIAAKVPDAKETVMSEQKTADDIRAAAVAEENRIQKVREVAKDFSDIQASAIGSGWSVEQTQAEVQKAELAAARARIAELEATKQQNERPAVPNVGKGSAPALNAKAIEASICLSQGMKDAEKRFEAEALNQGNDLKIRSMTDLVRACLAAEGQRLEASRHEPKEMLRAAFSTRNFANLLSNVANKFILEGFGTVEQTWRAVSAVRSVVDFKANTGVRLVMSNLLKELSPDGEIQHGQLSDETRSVTADTKALMLGVTRKDLINDDLSALTEAPRKLGYAAARTFNTDFWAAFEAAVGANFSASAPKKNQTTGALSLATLKLAEALFLGLKDADGNPIGADASVLLVSPSGAAAARELFASTNLVGGSTKEPSTNIYAGMFSPAVSRYLSAKPWYLVANPMAIPLMQTAFLNGRQEPFVESADADFNTLGIQMRCYYDYGVAFGEWRGAVRSTGE